MCNSSAEAAEGGLPPQTVRILGSANERQLRCGFLTLYIRAVGLLARW